MSVVNPPRIELVKFQDYQNGIMAVREAVFIDELGIDPQLEWDQKDAQAVYAIAVADKNIISIGRLQPDGQIGRVATLPPWRQQGIGRKILHQLIETARENGMKSVYLAAQVNAIHFYETLGFEVTGEVFHAAGIPHQRMSLCLSLPVTHTENR